MITLHIVKDNVKDAWLEAINQVLEKGVDIKTEYDKPEDPPSKDATVLIEVKNPLNEPIKLANGKIYKVKSKLTGKSYELYGHIGDLYLIESIKSGYIEEIINGINDHLIIDSETSFPYSYHDRIFNYKAMGKEDIKINEKIKNVNFELRTNDTASSELKHYNSKNRIWLSEFELPIINQITHVIHKLKEFHYSRRCQATTWRPYSDPFRNDPPCLQRLWFRVIDDKLTMQTCWRSRDLFKAWEANVNGMLCIQKMVADALDVEVGNYVDFSNSLHLYGKYMNEINDFLERIENRKE